MPPETRYAKSGGVSIAYQVVGDGPLDLVYVPGWVSHVELCWEEPDLARGLERLASFARLILFDKRGTGLSDRARRRAPTLEPRMDDVRAVMDAVGSSVRRCSATPRAATMCALFAATYPERTVALCIVRSLRARRERGYPWAPTQEEGAASMAASTWRAGFVVGRSRRERGRRRESRAGSIEQQSPHGTSPPRRRLRLQLNKAYTENLRPFSASIRVPTLVVLRRGAETEAGSAAGRGADPRTHG